MTESVSTVEATPQTRGLVRRVPRWFVWLVGGLAWLAAMKGAAAVAWMKTPWTSLFCGPWGCTARTEAVMSCHLTGLLVLGPMAWFAARRGRNWAVWFAAACLLAAVGGAAAAGWAGWQETRTARDNYLLQRVWLRFFGEVDVPAIPAAVVGTCLVAYLRWLTPKRLQSEPAENEVPRAEVLS